MKFSIRSEKITHHIWFTQVSSRRGN